MEKPSDLTVNNSILYRCTMKYYDKVLSKYNIGYGQFLFLMMIYEQEGITMKQISEKGSYDKGTITKSMLKLEENKYIRLEVDLRDKRSKLLYTTDKAKDIIANMYLLRKDWWEHLTQGLTLDEADAFEETMSRVVQNALDSTVIEAPSVRFFGLQKLTLLDYPGKMACTLFTGGCNFKCPFCQNADLVFLPENIVEIAPQDILSFLEKRKGILEGICVSGGEPLLQEGLAFYLKRFKDMGYQVKIDTNGTFPEKLKRLVEEGLVDYVAMDVKNSLKRYGETMGIEDFNLDGIKESIAYLKEGHVPYEFRTTIVKNFHSKQDMKDIGKLLEGADAYYLQNFEDSDRVIKSGLEAWDFETLKMFKDIVSPYVKKVEIRGIDE